MVDGSVVSSALDSLYSAKSVTFSLPRHHIARPRLLQTMRGLLPRPLLLLQAGPGTGKTCLLAEFASGSKGRAACYRLSGVDTGPVALLTGIHRAISGQLPIQAPTLELLAGVVMGFDRHSVEALLIDDTQRIEGVWLADMLAELISVAPAQTSIIVAVRSRSQLVERLVSIFGSDDRLAVLDGRALRLTNEEVCAFRDQFGQGAHADCRWPGCFAASWAPAHAKAVQLELIAHLSPGEQEALRTLAVIDEVVSPDIAGAMLGCSTRAATRLLERFESDGLLVAAAGPAQFKLSQDARDMFNDMSPEEQMVARRQVAVALWQSDPILSARYALAAQDYTLVLQALEHVRPLEWMVRSPSDAAELAASLPPGVLASASWPRYCHARELLRLRQVTEARALLRDDDPQDLAMRCELTWLRAFADLQEGRLDGVVKASDLLAELADVAQGVRWPLAALSLSRAGTMAGIAGRIERCCRLLEAAQLLLGELSPNVQDVRNELLLDVMQSLGLAYFGLARFPLAVRQLRRAVETAAELGRVVSHAECLNNLARALHNATQPVGALGAISRAFALEDVPSRQRAILLATQASIVADLGMHEQATGKYALALELAGGRDWDGLAHECQLGLVLSALALGRYDDAARARRWLASASDDQRLYFARMAGGMVALVQDQNPALAVRYFSEAIAAHAPAAGRAGQTRARYWRMVALWNAGNATEAAKDLASLIEAPHMLGGEFERELGAMALEGLPGARRLLQARFAGQTGPRVQGVLAHPATSVLPQTLRVQLIGPPRCEFDHRDVGRSWKYRRAEELFYFGVVRGPRGFTKEEAETALAPESSQHAARLVFVNALSKARQALERVTGVDGKLLIERGDDRRYVVRLDRMASDVSVDLFDVDALQHAVRLPDLSILEISGELLEGFTQEWAQLERNDWLARVRPGFYHVGAMAHRLGDHRTLERTARALLSINPHDVRAHMWLLECFAAEGNREGAKEHIEHYRENFGPGANASESMEMVATYQRLFASKQTTTTLVKS